MIRIEIIGNIGADAEKKTANGNEFIVFRVAHTTKFKDAAGNDKEETTWVDVTMNNADSKVFPFLKRGEKVYIRGNARLRVYSSPKDRCMKAGLTVMANEVELLGGNRDDVPRELINPENGALYKVSKYYQCDLDTSKFKKEDVAVVVDRQGECYNVIKGGWVCKAVSEEEQAENS